MRTHGKPWSPLHPPPRFRGEGFERLVVAGSRVDISRELPFYQLEEVGADDGAHGVHGFVAVQSFAPVRRVPATPLINLLPSLCLLLSHNVRDAVTGVEVAHDSHLPSGVIETTACLTSIFLAPDLTCLPAADCCGVRKDRPDG